MLLSELHPQQRRIVELVSEGYTNSEIASLLEISVPTVKNVLYLLSERTGSSNRYRLVLHFYKVIPAGKGEQYQEIT